MKFETRCVQVGVSKTEQTGSISTPIYQTATFRHPGLGMTTGYDYSRSGNPTREQLEKAIANLEQGSKGFAFASGMAAFDAVLRLFNPGDHLIVSDDLYGGTYRILEHIYSKTGLSVTYVDTTDVKEVERVVSSNTKAIIIETPSNPLMKITDIQAVAKLAKKSNLMLIVDNTFMTPYWQCPLTLGADIVIHSATKYLGGHNDLVAGLAVVKDKSLGEQLYFIQNSVGSILGPQDSWLLLRGMKTLSVRLEKSQQNAFEIALWLKEHPKVSKVYYPGLVEHPGYELMKKNSNGFGGMVSFDVVDSALVEKVLFSLELITFAESLGGVESLITYPVKQTHADIPQEIRESKGLTNRLLRLSVGIEHVNDLIDDLDQVLS